jgi:hypothetical protein
MHQEIVSELRWYFLDSGGDLGLRSNFESVANRIGGLHAPPQTSGDLDGRLLQNAGRYKRVANALKGMGERHTVVLHAFAMHRELGVMLIQKAARDAHREARSTRSLPEWLERIGPRKGKPQKTEHARLWLRIRGDATRELDRAIREFSTRWSRR